jgi:hypothetical protein
MLAFLFINRNVFHILLPIPQKPLRELGYVFGTNSIRTRSTSDIYLFITPSLECGAMLLANTHTHPDTHTAPLLL